MEYISLFVKSIFVDNMIFAYFLGMCSYLAVSKNVKTASGLGVAVIFVLLVTLPINYLLNKYVLAPDALIKGVDLSFLSFIIFIAVIAAFTQLVEMIVEKFLPSLYSSLGIFLPLITTNCAVLGVAILVIQKDFSLVHSIVYAFSTAIGFALAMVVFAGLREQLSLVRIPKGMQGMAIVLVTAGLLSLAFMGFSGVDGGLRVVFGLE